MRVPDSRDWGIGEASTKNRDSSSEGCLVALDCSVKRFLMRKYHKVI